MANCELVASKNSLRRWEELLENLIDSSRVKNKSYVKQVQEDGVRVGMVFEDLEFCEENLWNQVIDLTWTEWIGAHRVVH